MSDKDRREVELIFELMELGINEAQARRFVGKKANEPLTVADLKWVKERAVLANKERSIEEQIASICAYRHNEDWQTEIDGEVYVFIWAIAKRGRNGKAHHIKMTLREYISFCKAEGYNWRNALNAIPFVQL